VSLKVIQHISTILSQEKYRKIYLVLTVLLVALIFIPYLTSIKYDITNLTDYLELILIFVTLIFLYISTNKQELNRYKENYKFYKEKYSGHDLLCLDKISSSSIDFSDIKLEGDIRLNDIKFLLDYSEYNLPPLIEDQLNGILIEKFNIQEKTDYNGLTLSLKSINSNNCGGIEFKFQRSNYYNYLVTNMIPEYEILPNLTIRDYLEASGKKQLNSLDVALAENHLGISALVRFKVRVNGGETRKYLLIPKRSSKTTVFKGQLAPSISGAANIDTCSKNGNISIINFFEQEISEEIFPFFKLINFDDLDSFTNDFVNSSSLIGISRELKRLGKPELFFYFDYSSKVIELSDDLFYDKKDYLVIPSSSDKVTSEIDLSENDKFLLVDQDKFTSNLKLYSTKSSSKSSYKGEEIYTVFTEENFKVSESLFVNSIYFNRHITE
jgi:hypothetical protein